MSTTWIPITQNLTDGLDVSAETLNPLFTQYAQRDQYLYEQQQSILDKSTLVAFSQVVATSVSVGSVVYSDTTGLKPAINSFSATGNSSLFQPSNSCYALGIVKNVSTLSGINYADVYIKGLVTLPSRVDDPTNGLLQTGECNDGTTPFAPKPLYLSSVSPGKLTANPQGIAVFIGYALDRYTINIDPTVEEFSQFYINYRLNLLDRPAGQPILVSNTWTISNPSSLYLGWVPASYSGVDSVNIPTGASFWYNIPSDLTTDTSISDTDKSNALELKNAFPPTPSNSTMLVVNGVIQTAYANGSGTYIVNDFGIWWINATNGYQPWAQDLNTLKGSQWDVRTDWPTITGSNSYRAATTLIFSKFNPALRNSLVTSITPYNVNGPIQFVSKSNPTAVSNVGDLLAKFTLPTNVISGTSGTAISQVTFNPTTGNLDTTVVPNVSSLVGVGNINVSPVTGLPGVFNISSNGGLNGYIQDIDPINGDYQKMGLNYYLSLSNTNTPVQGLNGSFILPAGVSMSSLSFKVFLFGATGLAQGSISNTLNFSLSYSVAQVGSVLSNNVSTLPTITVAVPTTTAYSANTVFEANPFATINAAFTGDSIINFNITRLNTGSYTGNVGILGMYWILG